MIFLLALCALSAIALGDSPPDPPVWPSTWSAPFNETAKIITGGNTTGMFYYDAANNRARTDRANGQYDRYCGSVKPGQKTPCSHLVTEDSKRYLVFPELKYCCYCCGKPGCSVVRPDWMVQVNATYLGRKQLHGYETDEWNAPGLQPNYYYQTVQGKVPVELFQSPNDLMTFDVNQFSTRALPDSLFKLPSECSADKKCPLLSVCTVADQATNQQAV